MTDSIIAQAPGPSSLVIDETLDQHRWVKAITQAVEADGPYGVPADECDSYDEIEADLMKRGTLAQGSIRWPVISNMATDLLASRSKDMRLLYVLLLAAPHVFPERATLVSFVCAARFFELWGSNAYPDNRTKARVSSHIAKALQDMIGSGQRHAPEPEDAQIIMDACAILAPKLAEFSPDLGLSITQIGTRAVEQAVVSTHDAAAHVTPAISQKPATLDVPAPRSDQLRLDPTNERALKQSLATVAEFLLELDPANPLPYRLRRYATWFGIVSAPPLGRSSSRTVIQATSEDVADNYRTASERGTAELALVMRLERTCSQQPFWLEGQFLQHQLAVTVGRDEVARAIRDETTRFFRLVPGLETLQFSDGTPMVPPAVLTWMQETPSPAPAQELRIETDQDDAQLIVVDRAFQNAARKARQMAHEGHIDKALALLDESRAAAKGARNQTIWDVFILENLRDFGLKSHASQQAERLRASIAAMAVPDWEPELFKRLDKLRG